MSFLKKLSKKIFGEVDTQPAIDAANQGNQKARALLNPGIEANESALARVAALLNNPGSFEGTPGFRFALDESIGALDKSAAARGVLGSGGHQKELQQRAIGLANQDFGNEFNRFMALIGATNPNVRFAAGNERQLGNDLAGIHLGKENADMAGANSLFGALGSLTGAAIGRMNFGPGGFTFGSG